ncbi:Hypothetical Protein RradSPS_0899 [Rubrobacter radiotolerans]|uniref:Recombinase family protein n=1 Tax=Rubrobacter radiotolerans TaxID=42256 RepID=A0A023X142_RUBRA|nr:recombinase family protein [Rubrobacter radiotolerans]AHY46182.1 Hypothetical Protein RradSPS_0899 [Rubrobacter radiotolerans]MDX5893592.1 recombinase family protein [Rubrobacter radiotolerans]SMC04068.1 Resolvase, N terminal domain [Rubrobacter radiotolerans DSM 5868]
MSRAAVYIRTDPSDLPSGEDRLPDVEEQAAAVERLAAERGYTVVAHYRDLEAPGKLLYHKPALKRAIDNVKEHEEWEVLLAADERCFSETESARHELVHKFSLYGNRIECPGKSWPEFEAEMRAYRRKMSGR